MDGKMIVKICGLTDKKEAEYLNRYGADMAGFVVFFPKSRRNIELNKAAEIASHLDKSIKKVAVTVSPDLDKLREIEACGFDYIQIHGETGAEVFENAKIPVIKAFNVNDMKDFSSFSQYDSIKAYVFDAAKPGSGENFDYKLLDAIPRDGKPFILAGGLRPENVKAAAEYVRPDGVDVSTGVEFDFGGKDEEKVKAFIYNAREVDPEEL